MGRVAGCLALGLFLGIRKRRDEEERLEEAQRALRDTLQQVRRPWPSLCLPAAAEDRLLTKGEDGLMGPYAVLRWDGTDTESSERAAHVRQAAGSSVAAGGGLEPGTGPQHPHTERPARGAHQPLHSR